MVAFSESFGFHFVQHDKATLYFYPENQYAVLTSNSRYFILFEISLSNHEVLCQK